MEIASSVFGILSCLCSPNCLCARLGQQLKHMKNYKEMVEDLSQKMEALTGKESDVRAQLGAAEVQPGIKPKSEVLVWLKHVEELKIKVSKIEKELGEEKRRLKGCFPNYFFYMKLGKLATKMIEAVNDLQEKGTFTNGILIDLPDTGKTLCTSKLVGKTTADKALEAILKCLMDVKIGKIGVYGMGGIGKTTIMKNINNHLQEARLFDNTIWVTVSKALSLKKLQEDIAKSIKLNFKDEEDEEERSTKLYEALMLRKKFMLVLDDMWEAFPLEKVGIPEPTNVNGCKIVLTTRDRGVCRRMETQENIEIMLLSEDEAWQLFKEKVGGDEVLSSNLQDVAKLVGHECCRLPLAIITVGRALRQVNDVREWENALYELRGISSHEIKDLETVVYERLRFSYDRLRNDKIRACFLYCALYPEDFEIPREDLIEYWMGEGLIEEKGNRATILNKGHAVLNELCDACMLESVLQYNHIECVKMHDSLRDMAISITRLNPHFVVKAGNKLEDLLKEDEWVEDVERVSLMMTNIKRLPGQPNCPKLSTLLLQNNCLLRSVPKLFFHYMKSLRVLNLSDTSIETLPESITELENLHILILHCCRSLQKVPSLGKLKALRVLNLCGTKLEELPHGMEEMISLRRLDLLETANLRTVQAGILPNLSSLEDLDMRGSNWEWSSYSAGNVTAVSENLMSSTQLRRIGIHFSDLSNFVSYVRSMKLPELENFHFLIGQSRALDLPYNFSRHVEIHGCSPIMREGSLLLPDKTQSLHFRKCNLSRLSKLSCLSNAKNLMKCSIDHCDELEFILAANDGATILSTLESMKLKRLPNLRALCNGVVSLPTLSNLKTLNVKRCNGLRNLISFKLLQHLRNLEYVEVSKCRMMEEIIAKEDMVETNIITLQRLKGLKLTSLPKLKTIYAGTIIWSSLLGIYLDKCRHLKIPPLSSQNLAIKFISIGHNNYMEQLLLGEEENDEACYVKDDLITLPCLESLALDHLPALKRISTRPFICESLHTIRVSRCPWLKMLPLSVHNLPPTLECIEVQHCCSLEEIIAGEEQDEFHIVLPRLKELTLANLPDLKRICRQSLICSSLAKIKVKKCPQLRKLLSIENPTFALLSVNNPTFYSDEVVIKGSAEWWGALEWDDSNTKTLLHPHFKEEAYSPEA